MSSIEEAKNRGHALLANAERDLREGRITEAEWYERVASVITPAYLAADNPRAQSGHSGDADAWRYARGLVLEAVDRSGSFLDVGCANGHLLECLDAWSRERRIVLELYGLDIAPELVELAAQRVPRERLFVGNAFGWKAPRKFDFVRTGLEYVPTFRETEYVAYLLRETVAPGGRLLIGSCSEERPEHRESPLMRERLEAAGFRIAGEWQRPHRKDPRLLYKVLALCGA